MKPIYILGISESHCATAALLKDGQIVACAQEERFTRVKNQPGIPKKAIEYCLRFAKIKGKDLQKVAVADYHMAVNLGINFTSKMDHETKVSDKILFWFLYNLEKIFPQVREPIYQIYKKAQIFTHRHDRHERIQKLQKILRIPAEKFTFLDHHTCHGASSLYSSGFTQKYDKILIFTADGSGDFQSATASLWQDKRTKLLKSINTQNSLGFFFFHITQFLGLKPVEDEYKVMGLAAYVPYEKFKKLYLKLRNLITFDEKKLLWRFKLDEVLIKNQMPKIFKYQRFDHVAASAQKLLEETLTNWISKNIKKYNCSNIVCGGGVFANVKANKKIAEIDGLNQAFFMPSPGDESNAIGAAYEAYQQLNLPVQPENQPIQNLYLGPTFETKNIEKLTGKLNYKKFAVQKRRDIESDIANLLSRDEVVARFSGRLEFGARSLGNRSILANPKNLKVVEFINSAIKNRDFWMPFAPTILVERTAEYVVPHKAESPFMNVSFDTTEKAQSDLAAAIHQTDKTTRPQILNRKTNPQYYDLIKKFEAITGIGAVLNTSFNLHGEPIVASPEDAIRVFERSKLKYLAIENFLISKR